MRLRLHLRRPPLHRPQARRHHCRTRPPGSSRRGGLQGRREPLHQRPRNRNPPQRLHRDQGHQGRSRRGGGAQGFGKLDQVHARTHVRSDRSGGAHSVRTRTQGRHRASHRRTRGAGSRMRPRLYSRRSPQERPGHRHIQLPRLRRTQCLRGITSCITVYNIKP